MCMPGTGLFGSPAYHGGLAYEAKKMLVWSKAREVQGKDPSLFRMDDYGYIILYSAHGDRASAYGWEMDHIVPKALGGSDDYTNLRPLHHFMNASLGGQLGTILGRR